MSKDLREKTVEILLTVLALMSLAVLAGIVFYLFKEGLPIFKLLTPLNFIFGTDWYPVGDQPDFEIGSLIAGDFSVEPHRGAAGADDCRLFVRSCFQHHAPHRQAVY